MPGRSPTSLPDVSPSSSEVLLFLDARPASVLIVTYLVLSAVALIVAVGGCLRLAGHKWAWEHREGAPHVDGHMAMTRNSSMEETNLWLTRNSRYSSNASNISGLVFQVRIVTSRYIYTSNISS